MEDHKFKLQIFYLKWEESEHNISGAERTEFYLSIYLFQILVKLSFRNEGEIKDIFRLRKTQITDFH